MGKKHSQGICKMIRSASFIRPHQNQHVSCWMVFLGKSSQNNSSIQPSSIRSFLFPVACHVWIPWHRLAGSTGKHAATAPSSHGSGGICGDGKWFQMRLWSCWKIPQKITFFCLFFFPKGIVCLKFSSLHNRLGHFYFRVVNPYPFHGSWYYLYWYELIITGL